MPRFDTISIIGGGWSFGRVVDAGLLDKVPGAVIGVNDSALLPICRTALSMDRLWTEARWGKLREKAVPAWIRRSALKNIDREKWPWLHVFECDHLSHDFSEHPTVLNGDNSGFCALNLAYIWRPRRIVLFGFDMQRGPKGEPYWHESYPWRPGGATSPRRYCDWARGFRKAKQRLDARGVKVVNASDRSLLDMWPRVSPEEFLCSPPASCL